MGGKRGFECEKEVEVGLGLGLDRGGGFGRFFLLGDGVIVVLEGMGSFRADFGIEEVWYSFLIPAISEPAFPSTAGFFLVEWLLFF